MLPGMYEQMSVARQCKTVVQCVCVTITTMMCTSSLLRSVDSEDDDHDVDDHDNLYHEHGGHDWDEVNANISS